MLSILTFARATGMIKKLNTLCYSRIFLVKQSSARQAATEVSFDVSYDITMHKKPFSDGEFIMECILDVVNILCYRKKV